MTLTEEQRTPITIAQSVIVVDAGDGAVAGGADNLAFDRALAKAKAASAFGVVSTIECTRKAYQFAAPVVIDGISGLTIRGNGAELRTKQGAGQLESFFTMQKPKSQGGVGAKGVVIEGFKGDGGLLGGYTNADGTPKKMRDTDDHVTPGVTYSPDRALSFFVAKSSRMIGQAGYPRYEDVTVRDCDLFGFAHLPVFFQGIWGEVAFSGNRIERCLDSGFIWNESIHVFDNVVIYSQDNGLSLSRSNGRVHAHGNRIFSPWANGIMCGQWVGHRGPDNLNLHDNYIEDSSEHGFRIDGGSIGVRLDGNVVRRARRGAMNNSNGWGVGIYFSWLDETHPNRYVTISNNRLEDCERGGILFQRGTEDAEVYGNTIVRPGMKYFVNGTEVVPEGEGLYNFGISVSDTALSATNKRIYVHDNLVIDDRAEPVAYYATYGNNAVDWTEQNNRAVGVKFKPVDTLPTRADGAARMVARLEQAQPPVRIGIAGDSTGDDLAGADRFEWAYRGLQRLANRFPRIECSYRTSYYDAGAYRAFRIVPRGAIWDEFDGAGDLNGRAANTGQVWTSTAGVWTVSGGVAVPGATAGSNASLAIGTPQAGNGRRFSGMLLFDSTTPASERSITFDFGADVNNRLYTKIALSSGNVAYASVGKIIDSAQQNDIAARNPAPNAMKLGLQGAAVPFSVDVTPTAVRVYVGAETASAALTAAEFARLGGLTYFRMRATTAGGSIAVARLGIGDISEAPVAVDIYNGSKAGAKLADVAGDLEKLYPVQMDCLFVASSHNYATDDEATYQAQVDKFLDQFRFRHPSSGVVLVAQNPQYLPAPYDVRNAHGKRLAATRQHAARRGFGYLGLAEKYKAQPDFGVSSVGADGIHPVAAGHELAAEKFEAWLVAQLTP